MVFTVQYKLGQTKFCYPTVVTKTKPKINFRTVTGKNIKHIILFNASNVLNLGAVAP
jgi:hypothetical protein